MCGDLLPIGRGGEIGSGTNPGALNLMGGTFSYSSPNLNQGGGQPPALDLYVSQGAYLTFTGGFRNQGAALHVGYDAAVEADSRGTVAFSRLTGTVAHINGVVTQVTGQGLYVVDGATINGGNFSTVFGTLDLEGNANLRSSAINFGSGSTLQTGDTGRAVLGCDVTLNGATVRLGWVVDQYSTLVISGDMTLTGGSSISIDVNAASLSQCDQILAHSITLDGTEALYCFTSGGHLAGLHQYDVLTALGQLNGMFSQTSYYWLGDGTVWLPTYTPAVFELGGQDNGPPGGGPVGNGN